MKNVTFVIPAYNEENSIGLLLTNITSMYADSTIIVVDNNSSDRTAEIAAKLGAEVIFEKKQGKAHAIRTAFRHSDSKFVVMLDADNTYDPKDAKDLLEHLKFGDFDLVLGSRLKGCKEKGAITNTNYVGNRILSLIASLFYHPISDVCTGYWAFRNEVIDYLIDDVGLHSSGFEIEVEMFAKLSKAQFKISEIPISYKIRTDKAKLNSFSDGYKIFITLLKYK